MNFTRIFDAVDRARCIVYKGKLHMPLPVQTTNIKISFGHEKYDTTYLTYGMFFVKLKMLMEVEFHNGTTLQHSSHAVNHLKR